MPVAHVSQLTAIDSGWVLLPNAKDFYIIYDRLCALSTQSIPDFREALALLAPGNEKNATLNEATRNVRYQEIQNAINQLEKPQVSESEIVRSHGTTSVPSLNLSTLATSATAVNFLMESVSIGERLIKLAPSQDTLFFCGAVDLVKLKAIEVHNSSCRKGYCVLLDLTNNESQPIEGLIVESSCSANPIERVRNVLRLSKSGTILITGIMSYDEIAQTELVRNLHSYGTGSSPARLIFSEEFVQSQITLGEGFFRKARNLSQHIFWISEHTNSQQVLSKASTVFTQPIAEIKNLKAAWNTVHESIVREAIYVSSGLIKKASACSGFTVSKITALEEQYSIIRNDPWKGDIPAKQATTVYLKDKDLQMLLQDSKELLVREAFSRNLQPIEELFGISSRELRRILEEFNINPNKPYDYSVSD